MPLASSYRSAGSNPASCHSKDRTPAAELTTELEAAGLQVVDPIRGFDPGGNFFERAAHALEASQEMVFVASLLAPPRRTAAAAAFRASAGAEEVLPMCSVKSVTHVPGSTKRVLAPDPSNKALRAVLHLRENYISSSRIKCGFPK